MIKQAAVRPAAVVLAMTLSTVCLADDARNAAQTLFDDAMRLMAQRAYDRACPKLEDVVRLQPGKLGAMMELARCYEESGKIASAWSRYRAVADAPVEDARRAKAKAKAEALAGRVPKLVVGVAAGNHSVEGFRVERDGRDIALSEWGLEVPVDPGRHVLRAWAPGKREWVIGVDLVAGSAPVRVEVPLLPEEARTSPTPSPPAVPAQATGTGPPLAPPPSNPAPTADLAPKAALSHRGQVGAILRADVDGQARGVVFAAGLSYGLGDWIEVTAAALVGRSMGFEPGANVMFSRGTWKPMIGVGAPIFFYEGARPGIRASAGVQWDPLRNLGVFALVGFAAFPNAPAGTDNVVFLPTFGIEPRL